MTDSSYRPIFDYLMNRNPAVMTEAKTRYVAASNPSTPETEFPVSTDPSAFPWSARGYILIQALAQIEADFEALVDKTKRGVRSQSQFAMASASVSAIFSSVLVGLIWSRYSESPITCAIAFIILLLSLTRVLQEFVGIRASAILDGLGDTFQAQTRAAALRLEVEAAPTDGAVDEFYETYRLATLEALKELDQLSSEIGSTPKRT